MKTILVVLSFTMFLLNFRAAAQDFAPVGAVWHYTERWAFSGKISYLSIRSVKDTIIQGISCQRLDCNELCLYPSFRQYVHYSNDSLYRYNPDFQQFQLIAAFNAKKGESWKFSLKDRDESTDTITVKVDLVNMVTINQKPLRQLFVTYNVVNYSAQGQLGREFSYNSRIVEKIGDVQYLFNFPLTAMVVCDANYSDGLRCYEDGQFGFYSTGIAESCTYTGIKNYPTAPDIKIFPNPTHGILYIHSPVQKNVIVQVKDMAGRCLMAKTLDISRKINLAALPSGLYIVTVLDHQHIIGHLKVIKK